MLTIHEQSIERACYSLEGLSVGDTLGNNFNVLQEYTLEMLETRSLPGVPWGYTDDTNMALSIVACLARHQKIDQDWLAHSFAEHFDLNRHYGVGMYRLLEQIKAGKPWSKEVNKLFYGTGSYGNGGAMRIAPLGAYFADDLYLTVQQAKLSAEVTHAHPEGIAGTVAVAVAAALAWQFKQNNFLPAPAEFLYQLLPYVPDSEVKAGITQARALPPETTSIQAAKILGSGYAVSAQDTVPFAVWCAARNLTNI